MMRMLLIIAAVSLTVASDVAYAGASGAGGSGFSWNQVAADESARYWAAQGWCFPGGWLSWGVPCAALQPALDPNRVHTRKHVVIIRPR